MSGAPAEQKRRAVYADLEAVPRPLVAEIIDGVLITSPRPAARHARALSRLTIGIGGPFDRGTGGPGGWVILDEPELHLGPEPDVLVPDLAGWRRQRMPEIPDVVGFTLPPDWICEVLSSSTAAVVRADKMPIFAREGVGHAWLVDPLIETLEVLRLDGGTWRLMATHRGQRDVRAEPFDAVELALGSLWER